MLTAVGEVTKWSAVPVSFQIEKFEAMMLQVINMHLHLFLEDDGALLSLPVHPSPPLSFSPVYSSIVAVLAQPEGTFTFTKEAKLSSIADLSQLLLRN